MTAWTAVRDALLVLAVAPFVYYILAIVAATHFFCKGSSSASPDVEAAADFSPPVSILKPIHGLDREAYRNYASFCQQDYPGFEILFCVGDESDPAIPVIQEIIRDFSSSNSAPNSSPDSSPHSSQRSIRLLIGSEPVGVSDKVNKLCRMVREARHEILLVNDSDVRVESGFLRAVVAPFRDSQVGGVTCLYRGLTDGSFAADMEALGNSTDFAPGVLVAWMFGGSLDFMLGAVMATTKKNLVQIGGFESLADYFCDDYELGNRLAASGHPVELSRFPVDIVYPHQTLAQAFRHQVRWNLSIRYSRPWGHLGLIFTQGIFWAALVAMLSGSSWLAACYLAGYLLLRALLATVVGVRGMHDDLVARRLWLLPLRDAFAFVVWLASFFPQRIHWRDREFYVRKKRLVPIPPRNS